MPRIISEIGRANVNGVLLAGIALLFPGVTVGVIAVALPETELVVVEKLKAADPFDTFPGVQMRDDQTQRAAVLGGEGFTIVFKGKEHIGTQKVG